MKDKSLIYGIRPIIEAIKSGKNLEKVLIQKDLRGELFKEAFQVIREAGIIFQFVPVEKLNRLNSGNHQGMMAWLTQIEYHPFENVLISAFENGKTPLILVLDKVTDVRNFGSIARTAECSGVDAIVVPAQASAMITSDAIKTSAGALHIIPVTKVKSLIDAVKYMKNSGLTIVAATEKGSDPYYNADFKGPMALIMGAEDVGISNELIRLADAFVKIPLQGKIDSLNVAVATGIILFEVARQRSE